MKYWLTVIALLAIFFCSGQTTTSNCRSFTKAGWKLTYNRYLGKYAVVRIDSSLIGTGMEKEFLVKDHAGEYGIYGEGWEKKYCYTCGDREKSLFKNSCDAKKFLLEYLKQEREYYWD